MAASPLIEVLIAYLLLSERRDSPTSLPLVVSPFPSRVPFRYFRNPSRHLPYQQFLLPSVGRWPRLDAAADPSRTTSLPLRFFLSPPSRRNLSVTRPALFVSFCPTLQAPICTVYVYFLLAFFFSASLCSSPQREQRVTPSRIGEKNSPPSRSTPPCEGAALPRGHRAHLINLLHLRAARSTLGSKRTFPSVPVIPRFLLLLLSGGSSPSELPRSIETSPGVPWFVDDHCGIFLSIVLTPLPSLSSSSSEVFWRSFSPKVDPSPTLIRLKSLMIETRYGRYCSFSILVRFF